MEQLLMVSMALLWIGLIGVACYAAWLHKRFVQRTDSGHSPQGLQPNQSLLIQESHGAIAGQLFPRLQFTGTRGERIDLSDVRKEGTFLAFTSTGCTSCKSLYTILNHFAVDNPQYHYVYLMNGSPADIADTIEKYNIQAPIAEITSDGMNELMTSYVPFVYFLDPKGGVISKSVVNYMDQLYALSAKAKKSAA